METVVEMLTREKLQARLGPKRCATNGARRTVLDRRRGIPAILALPCLSLVLCSTASGPTRIAPLRFA